MGRLSARSRWINIYQIQSATWVRCVRTTDQQLCHFTTEPHPFGLTPWITIWLHYSRRNVCVASQPTLKRMIRLFSTTLYLSLTTGTLVVAHRFGSKPRLPIVESTNSLHRKLGSSGNNPEPSSQQEDKPQQYRFYPTCGANAEIKATPRADLTPKISEPDAMLWNMCGVWSKLCVVLWRGGENSRIVGRKKVRFPPSLATPTPRSLPSSWEWLLNCSRLDVRNFPYAYLTLN